MILRQNLASAPIKNYSLFLLGCFALALIAVSFTIYNVFTLTGGIFQSQELGKSIAADQAKINKLERDADQLSSGIGRISTPQFISETEFMNNAIKRRVFSWTTLFNKLEQALPENVRMLSVTPSIAGESISVSLELQAQSLQDMVEFIKIFNDDSAFSEVVLRGEQRSDEGLMNFSVSLRYFPPKPAAARGVVQ
jgi:hypothetical protein